MSVSAMNVLGRERAVLAVALTVVTALSWLYLVRMAGHDAGMSMAQGSHTVMAPLSGAAVVLIFVMWTVMMIGMMLPSAAPAILMFDAANRRRGARPGMTSSYLFAAGYLAAWTAFSLAAALAQWGLYELSLMASSMTLARPGLAGAVLVATGVFQWTPAKRACLRYCRSPFGLVATGWPADAPGVFRLGVKLGLFCIGCCWALMALMFVGGVMSLLWMVLIAGAVLVEKVMRGGERFARLVGVGLVLYGVWLLLA